MSSATPITQPPAAVKAKPTVECTAMLAPRNLGSAAAAMPEVSAPESPGTVKA
jgi:hypothetical protein